MALFAVPNSTTAGGGQTQQAISATYKTICLTGSSTTSSALTTGVVKRGRLYDILIGTIATPADNYYEYDVVRANYASSTAITTGGALMLSSVSAGLLLDVADGAPLGNIVINSSVETYLTSPIELWYVGVNQRASYRWVAAPGSEFVYPAVSTGAASSNSALALRARSSAGTGSVSGTILVNEL